MKRCLLHPMLYVLLVACSMTPVFAQTWLPSTSKPAWNTYVTTVIPDRFSSIIGSGGTRIANRNTITANSWGERRYTIPMPMSFYFMGTNRTQGSSVMISTDGYITW